jgi:hypothetical protein
MTQSQPCDDAIDCGRFCRTCFPMPSRRLEQARRVCLGVVRRDRLVATISTISAEDKAADESGHIIFSWIRRLAAKG